MKKVMLMFFIVSILIFTSACAGSPEATPVLEVPDQSAVLETPISTNSEFEPFPLGEPIILDVSLVENEVTEAEIGYEGGQLRLESSDGAVFQLDIPEGALLVQETLRMQRIDRAEGVPFEDSNVVGVHLEPEGLFFMSPAQLTIQLPESAMEENVATFGTLAGGRNFQLLLNQYEQNVITLQVMHFSDYGAKALGADEMNALAERYRPSTNHASAHNEYRTIVRNVEDSQAIFDATVNIFKRLFSTSTKPFLDEAVASEEILESAWFNLHQFLGDIYNLDQDYLVEKGFDKGAFANEFQNEINAGADTLAEAIRNAIEKAHERCVQNNDPNEAVRMYRWAVMTRTMSNASWIKKISPDWHLLGRSGLTEEWIGEKMASCFIFEFQFVSEVTVPPSLAGAEWKSKVRSNIPMDIQSIEPGAAVATQKGFLTFDSYSVKPLDPGCDPTIETGAVEIKLDLVINPRYEFTEVLFPRITMTITDRPVLGFACGGIEFNPNDFSWWYRGFNDAMEDDYAKGSETYEFILPIVDLEDTYAYLEISGTSKNGAIHDSAFRLVHKPED